MDWLRSQFELAHSVRPMEGLRGFAVALVFLVHYVSLSGTASPLAIALHTIGNSGVDLFFVLSGYLIYGSLIKRPQSYTRFMARRVERIYPTWTVVFGMYLALSLVLPAESKIPAGVDGWIYLAQNFLLLPGIFPIKPMVTVAWSLSYELFFYLAMPIVIGIVGIRARSTTWRVTFILLAAGSYGYLCVTYGGLPRLLMFAAGMLLYEALRIGVRGPGTFAALVAVAGAFSAMLVEFRPIGATGQVIGLFVAFPLLCLASFQAGMLANVFSWAPCAGSAT